jgi:hypothetical protein
MVCASEGWVDVENSGNSKLIWLQILIEIPKGIPLHDAIRGVFSMGIGGCHNNRSMMHP